MAMSECVRRVSTLQSLTSELPRLLLYLPFDSITLFAFFAQPRTPVLLFGARFYARGPKASSARMQPLQPCIRRFGLMPQNYALNSIISICICTINENMFLYLCFSYLHFPMVTPHAVTVFGLTINNSALKNNLQPDCFWKMKNPQLFVFFSLSSHCHWPLAGCPK